MGINKVVYFLSALDPRTAINQTIRHLPELLDIFPNLVSEPLHDNVHDKRRKFFHITELQEYADKSV